MTGQVAARRASGQFTGVDWTVAAISFFLTPIAPLTLSLYNFARSRPAQGLLYLIVLVLQLGLTALGYLASR